MAVKRAAYLQGRRATCLSLQGGQLAGTHPSCILLLARHFFLLLFLIASSSSLYIHDTCNASVMVCSLLT